MEQPRKAVVVTGFGPFGEHTVNASWVAVQELEKLGLGDSVDLHVYEIPVEYKTVQRLIPALWEKHSPQLVVHVGVSGMATTVTLEKCGHNKGYKGLDNCHFCPGSQCCVEDGPESIDSIIDMDAVCKRVTTLGLDVSVTISQDAGRCPSREKRRDRQRREAMRRQRQRLECCSHNPRTPGAPRAERRPDPPPSKRFTTC
ncbi:pyroglutamyl-peptidase 1 isoform X3 [Artibeus jamaicensis]|uniref:pyroglutamyl-peptidase 1 isoform X3 n=1 Tax=Artibeus jamaicensis TaxID=9417 RepID=UPI00235A5719|nr:pyroglutamyl-peptidase 1 isoform X3 [Artibeus jamaicensis]